MFSQQINSPNDRGCDLRRKIIFKKRPLKYKMFVFEHNNICK